MADTWHEVLDWFGGQVVNEEDLDEQISDNMTWLKNRIGLPFAVTNYSFTNVCMTAPED